MKPVSLEFTLIEPDDIILNYQSEGQDIYMLKALHKKTRWGTTLRLAGVLSVQRPNANLETAVVLVSIKNIGETAVLLDYIPYVPGDSVEVYFGLSDDCAVEGVG
ncbi:hypothetical protein [Pseudomonas fluorescens]|uniref:hypothetical protein n=1 Tax=Pseudomonas fluorescens TaxID=294 RepID=UPI0020065494|nr:hypothetical protein [Pseudomonas fluorescens]MCK3832920.1 hypothetical protein [Pseudomonas fluorescens]